jgi:hypothetical protein
MRSLYARRAPMDPHRCSAHMFGVKLNCLLHQATRGPRVRAREVGLRAPARLASRNGCCCGLCPGFSATPGENAETKLEAGRERRHNDVSRDGDEPCNANALAYRRWQLASASTFVSRTSAGYWSGSAVNVQLSSNQTTPSRSNRTIATACSEHLSLLERD